MDLDGTEASNDSASEASKNLTYRPTVAYNMAPWFGVLNRKTETKLRGLSLRANCCFLDRWLGTLVT
jgi:hypothetical protein